VKVILHLVKMAVQEAVADQWAPLIIRADQVLLDKEIMGERATLMVVLA
jgi:hypothetical protein